MSEPSKHRTPRPKSKRDSALDAMRQASDEELTAMIRRQLALPISARPLGA